MPRMGRPRTPDIERRILDAARSFIASRGPGGVSMDEIARKAGITKTTLYVYFRSKQGLFEAVVDDLLAQLPPACGLVPGDSNDPIETQLLIMAKRVHQLLSSESFKLIRRALASDLRPSMRERMWKTAGLPYVRAIDGHLLDQARQGRLDLEGSRCAASWFLALVAGGDALLSQWHGASDGVPRDDHLPKAVQLFLSGHAPRAR